MADHLHKQIRAGTETALTGLTTSGSRVYANRAKAMGDNNLPGLRIMLQDEDASVINLHDPQQQERDLALDVECCAKGTDTLDDVLDQMSKEVEVALAAGITIGSKKLFPTYQGMSLDLQQGELVIGVKRLRFNVNYTCFNNTPDSLSLT